MKKIIAVLLALALLISAGTIGAFASEKITDCGKDCEYYPTIIVPGLGQSNTWVLDDNGDYVLDDEGNKITSFPAYIELDKVIARVAAPALMSLIFQRDIGLSEAAADAIKMCFEINASDENGQLSGNVVTEKYPYPLSVCNDYERNKIYHHVPFNLYENDQPLDHMYYFAYNSFGNHADITKELYDFIQLVKKQSGHDKVNLVPLSQGASIVSAMLDYYPQSMDELHKIIFVVPALDGSKIIGDVLNDRIAFLDPEYLYNGFFGELGLLDQETAAMIETALRILPDEVIMAVLEAACETLVTDVLRTCPSMWALCPSADYPTAAEKYLSDPEMQNIKKQTDRYYQAQLNADANIEKLLEKGVQVFCIAEYDYPLINVGESWDTQNADYIIHLDSTSLGAYAANVGETLPEDYVQQNTVCKDPTHNHISPDRVIDASTGLLPDTTFYFDNQRHDLTARNDVILKLALCLIECDDIQNVYSDPRFPQFNIARGSEKLVELVKQAKTVDVSTLSAEDAAELAAAIAEAERVTDNTIGVVGEVENAENRLYACLVNAGLAEPVIEEETTEIFTHISPWLYENFGTDGYSEIAFMIVSNVITTVTNVITKLI